MRRGVHRANRAGKSMRASRIASDVLTDSIFALRSFMRSPGWTAVTLLTIALGVGASTAVFRVADTFVIRPLAYPAASRVYTVSLEGRLRDETESLPISPAAVREWRNSARTIEGLASYGGGPRAFLHGDLEDLPVTTVIVDTGFFVFAGARPLLGRNFTADEISPNGPRAIIISEGFWRRQFGGSRDVLGKVVRLDLGGVPDLRPSTIVGVMPASLVLPDLRYPKPDIWLPLVDGAQMRIRAVAVRLTRGATAAAANQELAAIFNHAGGFDPDFADLKPHIRVSRPQDDLPFRQALMLLAGAVVLLLLIACSNVSHLLLQRGLTRERELAIRHALGAHRARLVMQLVTESTLLGVAGGALAMLVGWGVLGLLMRLRPTSFPELSYLSTTRGVIPFAAGLAIAVGLIVGVLGALHIAHRQLAQSLRTGASSASRTHRRLRGTLVVGQIALSAILLSGAILLIRDVFDLERQRLGFDPHELYAVSFRDLNANLTSESVAAFAATIRNVGERVLGSRDLTIANNIPSGMDMPSALETREQPGVVRPSGFTSVAFVAPDYFTTLRMPLIAGRTFDEGSFSRNEVIVSRALAQQLWDDGKALGQQFRNTRREGRFQQWHTVVGVVPDILTNRLGPTAQPMLYQPFPGGTVSTTLIVRLDRQDAANLLRRFARSVQPDPRKWDVRDVNIYIEQSIAEPRFTMSVLVLFAGCGVVLAAIGLLGVVSYSLRLRTREIGVRITLGATRRNIASLFLRDALGQVAIGTAIGLAGAVVITRLARMSFYGIQSFDNITFVLAAVSMLLVSLAACAGPLFRAMSVDPVVAIRAE
jgi:putative ABC transport system permease protein